MSETTHDTASNKTLSILEALAEHSRLGDIAAASGMSKPTTHRILQTLVARGFASSDGRGGYSAGSRVFSLVGQFLDHLDLPRQARPMLCSLQQATGWTVHLAVPTGEQAVYVSKVEGEKPYHLASRVGMPVSLHCTALGKSLLAGMTDVEVGLLLHRAGMPARTANTITERGRLLEQLAEIRDRGYAEDREENELGVLAVGAPVFDHVGLPIAAISAAALTYHPVTDSPGERGRLVAGAAAQLSRELGATADKHDLRRMRTAS